MILPCFYTTLTTIVAFCSLLFSNIKPIIDFGNIMIVGLIFILISSFTILPLIISYFPNIKNIKKVQFKILNVFNILSTNYIKTIIITNLIVFIISIYGIYQLNVENSFINYFKSNTEIYKGMKLIDRELGGTTPIDIIINFKNNEINMPKDLDNLQIDDDLNLEDLDLMIEEDLFDDLNTDSNWFTQDKLNTIEKIHKYLESKK